MKWCQAFAAAFAAAFAVSGAALAQTPQKIRLQLASAFPTSLTLIGEAPVKLSKKIERASAGAIELKINEPGALVPALQAIQATSQGSVDAAWSNAGFFAATDTAFNMFATVPFGPEMGEYMGWMRYGGGEQLMQEISRKYKVEPILCGTIAPEASGWFRKEIKSVDDLKGLRCGSSDWVPSSCRSSASRRKSCRPAKFSRHCSSAP